MNYQQKYLKYKSKYLELKGGTILDFSNKADVLILVNQSGYALEYVSEELRADREVVLTAVNQNGTALGFASKELQADRDVVLAAVTNMGYAIRDAAPHLQADREVVLTAVTNNGDSLRYVLPEYTEDLKVVLTAVTHNGNSLLYASQKFKADREVVLTAVTKNGEALLYASETLKEDREVVLTAVSQNGWALKDASKELQAEIKAEANIDPEEYNEVFLKLEGLGWYYKYIDDDSIDDNKVFESIRIAAAKLLRYYENKPINILNFNGDVYILPNIRQFTYINNIKQWLRTNHGIGEGNFDIRDLETNTRIISILQLREYIFKLEIDEAPEFIIAWLPDDELPNRSKSLQLPNSDKYPLPQRSHSSR